MNPRVGDAKVDKILSDFSQMYRNDDYIAEKILPVLAVKEKTGKYAKYGKENLRAYLGAIYRAPGTRAHSVDYSVSQGTYICTEKAVEKIVPDEMYKNCDDPYDPERDATEVAMDNVSVNQELALSIYLSNTANITLNTTLSGTDKWSDKTNSDPMDDIDTAIASVKSNGGRRPNVIVFAHNAWLAFKSHPDIREQLKYSGANGNASDSQVMQWIKDYWRLEEVLIGEAVYNSADAGQTDDLDDIWTNNVWVMYRSAKPSLMRATFGLTLTDLPKQVDVYREESHVRNVVRVRYSYDQNVFDSNFCYLIKSAV